jgi:nanoRNase/pAp phosphatase (c-di-AMP/oligoRNAs hydrolase)
MRLVTRPDFDGLACAVLLEELGIIDDYLFMHPKDIQDGKVSLSKNDVLANVPYSPGCGMWFDHHSTELERLQLNKKAGYGSLTRAYRGFARLSPSCARVIYDYYNGPKELKKFDNSGLMWAIDKFDPADLSQKDILEPEKWILLAFIIDVRTGLGRYKNFRIDHLELLQDTIKYCRSMPIEDIIEVPDIVERTKLYFEHQEQYKKVIKNHSRTEKNVIVIDYRDQSETIVGNRFIEYALYPDQNVSVKAFWGLNKQNVVLSVGHSIVNKSSKKDVGSLMLKYGGGGHFKVGTCQIVTNEADKVIKDIINKLQD